MFRADCGAQGSGSDPSPLRYGAIPGITTPLRSPLGPLDDDHAPPLPAGGLAGTFPAPVSSGAAGPALTNPADAAEYGGALVIAAEVAVE